MKKEATQSARGSKAKTSNKKKRQPQNARGSRTKTSDEKTGNAKTQGAQKQRPLTKNKMARWPAFIRPKIKKC
jgi:hypothetical protein